MAVHMIANQSAVDGSSETYGSEIGSDALIPPEILAELVKSAKLIPPIHPHTRRI